MPKEMKERQAKKYVRRELVRVHELESAPLNEQVEELGETFKQLIDESKLEYSNQNIEELRLGRYYVLKNRLIHLFVSGRYTNTQIARIMGVHPATVSKWLTYPDTKKAIEQYQMEENAVIDASMRALRVKAIEKASEILDGDNEMVQAVIIKDIFDRTGHKAVDKKEIHHTVTYEQKLQQLMNNEIPAKKVEAEYAIDDDTAKINTEGEEKVIEP